MTVNQSWTYKWMPSVYIHVYKKQEQDNFKNNYLQAFSGYKL